jgi:hypothetical protein
VAVSEKVLAGKVRLDRVAALALARKADQVIALRGKKIVRFRMADRPGDAELAAAILGPSGSLRAPAIRIGKILVIGFADDVYRELLGR